MALEQFRDVDVVLDKINDNIIQGQFVSEGDYNGRTMTVMVTNSGIIGAMPGLQLSLLWTNKASKLNDEHPFQLIDAEKSIFRIEFPNNMLTAGTVVAYIRIWLDGKVMTTKPFNITVGSIAGKMSGVIQQQEFGLLTAVLADANGFKTDINRKINRDEVKSLIANITSGEPKGVYNTLNQLTAAYPNGASGIYLVGTESNQYKYIWNGEIWENIGLYQPMRVDKYSIDDYMIKDKVLSLDKLKNTATIANSINMLNPTAVTFGVYANPADGTIKSATSNDIYMTDFIFIPKNSKIYFPAMLSTPGAIYDDSKKYIRPLYTQDNPYTALQDIYIRWNGDMNYPPKKSMITIDAPISATFIPYRRLLKITDYPLQTIASNTLQPNVLHGVNLVNLFNKDKVTDNTYVDGNGNIRPSSILCMSAPIPINPASVYRSTRNFSDPGVWLDENMEYAGPVVAAYKDQEANNGPSIIILPPANARYAMLNVFKDGSEGHQKHGFMFVEGTVLPDRYVPYGATVDWLNTDATYHGIKIATFGDSVTWYDGKQYVDATTTSGQQAVGYQSYIRKNLKCQVDNQGVSGNTTQQIATRSMAFDYSGYDIVTIMAGINNFFKENDEKFGGIMPIGSEFTFDTFCGAYQTMIEDIITRHPKAKIALIVPYKVYVDGKGVMPIKFRDTIVKLGEMYGLPVCDLYGASGINELNYTTYMADDRLKVNYYLHVNNDGYKLVADQIVPFLKSILTTNV